MKVADSNPSEIPGYGTHKMPGEEEYWLIGERRADGEEKYYLSNRPEPAELEELVCEVKCRWACEQVHQQMKDELGLDHFEGRSWTEFHRHALLVMIAHYVLQVLRMDCEINKPKKKGKKSKKGPKKEMYTLPAMRRIVLQEIVVALLPKLTCPCCNTEIKLLVEHLFPNGVYRADPVPYEPFRQLF